MRPSKLDSGEEVYECFDCGERTTDAEQRLCESCGGTLRNLGKSRDL